MSAVPMSRLTDRQRELLRSIVVTSNIARFDSDEQIEDWAALKTVLVGLGGKWNRKAKGFIFEDDIDADERVRVAKETGQIIDFDAAGFFPTPAKLADRLVAKLNLQPNECVLEPSAGRGAIIQAIWRAQPEAVVIACEMLDSNFQHLKKTLPKASPSVQAWLLRHGDFLSLRQAVLFETFMGVAPSITACAMNPPFAKRADILHVKHALTLLRPGGRLAAIMSAGVTFREDNLTRDFREMVARADGTFEPIEEGAFKESGTMVRTVMLTMTKP